MTTSDGQEQLVFQTDPEHRWRILKLVDDDYLRSSMTDHRYEVNFQDGAPPRPRVMLFGSHLTCTC